MNYDDWGIMGVTDIHHNLKFFPWTSVTKVMRNDPVGGRLGGPRDRWVEYWHSYYVEVQHRIGGDRGKMLIIKCANGLRLVLNSVIYI